MAGIEVIHKHRNRLCMVGDEYGCFHVWELSITSAPTPDGVVSRTYGIVEFPDGIKRVEATDIHFCDNDNEALRRLNKRKRKKDVKEDS